MTGSYADLDSITDFPWTAISGGPSWRPNNPGYLKGRQMFAFPSPFPLRSTLPSVTLLRHPPLGNLQVRLNRYWQQAPTSVG